MPNTPPLLYLNDGELKPVTMLRQILVRLAKHKTKKNLRSTGFPYAFAILAETSLKQINTPSTLMPA
jgi:hypothetical protein